MKLTIYEMATLLMGVTMLAACSDGEDIIDVQPVQPGIYTLSVESMKSLDAQASTRALTLSGSTLNATWATTDRVYVKKDDSWATGSLQPIAAGATATLKGTLSDVTIAAGDELTLQYPKSGALTYSGQKGTLADIAENFDYATATATVTAVSANGMVAATAASFQNQQAIVKFTLLDDADGTTPINATNLTVTVGSNTYSVNPTAATNVFYVAIPGFSGRTVTLTATVGNDIYINIYTYTKSGITFENGKFYDITVKMTKTMTLTSLGTITSAYTAQDGEVLTGTLTSKVQISIADGAVVTLNNVTIDGENDWEYKWAGITCQGNATIILAEGTTNNVKGFYADCPGIYVPKGSTLTIRGSGALNASSPRYGRAAGIGGGYRGSCGDITISGGNVTASAEEGGAGIGSGYEGSCGTITISGGNVTAIADNYGAGIGSGRNGSCGDISISGGTIEASSKEWGAGIGSGSGNKGSCGDITISGGNVTASAEEFGAGIGSGYMGSCKNITISGGTVTASSDNNGAGIGSGQEGSCVNITINGGTVAANGGNWSAGIGSGAGGSCGDITILNTVTKVTATKGSYASHSIGAYDSDSTIGTVTIGGVVGAISTSPYTYQPE